MLLLWKTELHEYFKFVVWEVNITLLAQGYSKTLTAFPFFAWSQSLIMPSSLHLFKVPNFLSFSFIKNYSQERAGN